MTVFVPLCGFTQHFAGVICLCWDRLSRNDQDGMIIKELMDSSIDLQFVQANYEKSSSGALHRDIDGMFAQHYSRVISEKVKAANEKLRAEGKCLYPSPIGYLDNGSDQKELDSERAPIIKRIFELYATGDFSLSQLAKWANKQGLNTKPLRRRRTVEEILSGKEDLPKVPRKVNLKTIEGILKNPFYLGRIQYKGKVLKGLHPALINVSMFNKVQKVLQSKNVKVTYIDKKFFTYRGLVRCSCGRVYSPYTKKGINYYRSKCLEDCGNAVKNVRESDIDVAVESVLGQIHFSDEELAYIQAHAKTELDLIAEKRNGELADLENQRRRIYGDLDYLKKEKITLLRNGISVEEYNRDVARLEEELEAVEIKMSVYSEAESEMLKYVLTFSELVKMACLYYKKALDTEKREIACHVFSELHLYGGKVAYLKAKEGFEALLKWRGMRSGGPEFCFSELVTVYFSVKITMDEFKRVSWVYPLKFQKKFGGLKSSEAIYNLLQSSSRKENVSLKATLPVFCNKMYNEHGHNNILAAKGSNSSGAYWNRKFS
jgi:predicted nucleotidyltransferase